ncbi:MAG TPA: pyrroline-5-carboxylate reductase [Terracidiphilus sp.]|jgi:pyrroline-5-carboxylate reductase|nr:pyrroline-5-carboxylate reductase [Terracidiphilus sp.]
MAEIPVEASEVPAQLPKIRVAVLGAGKMGGILLQAFLKENLFSPDKLYGTVNHAEKAIALSTQWGVDISTDNLKAASHADLILIGVKPFQVPDLIAEIKPALTPAKTIISFAASVKTRSIEEAAGMEIAVIRAMPNTPSALGAGVAALCRGSYVSDEKLELAERIFETVGRTVIVDEKHMDAVTGLSGSGPAYIYIIIEALAEAGVKVGLPRDTATQLAAQTAYGAAKMVLETGYHPALLKDAVTTPAGCTIDGILELEEGGLRVTLIKAVMRATERARQLAAG